MYEQILKTKSPAKSFASSPSQAPARPVPEAAQPGESTGLGSVYRRWFEVVPAMTDALRERAYRLRFQVYCVEHAFEDPADNPDGMETDAFDAHSVHSLLVYRPSGDTAGTVRLVLPAESMGAVRLVLPQTGKAGRDLPIHQVCRHPVLSDPAALPPETTAEISRFAISKQFRRRREDGEPANPTTPEERLQTKMEDRRRIPHITLGLMNAIARMSAENGITHWCAIMEPALLRLLSRLGIHFEPLGPLIEHHGRRQPVYAAADELLARIWEERPDVWEVITDSGVTWPLSKRSAAS